MRAGIITTIKMITGMPPVDKGLLRLTEKILWKKPMGSEKKTLVCFAG